MLILTRNIQQAIMIGDNVTITVLSVNGNQVRLGIDAPRDVEVHREEIYHRIHDGGMDVPAERKLDRITPDTAPVYSQPSEVGERSTKQPVILKKKRRVISKDNE